MGKCPGVHQLEEFVACCLLVPIIAVGFVPGIQEQNRKKLEMYHIFTMIKA